MAIEKSGLKSTRAGMGQSNGNQEDQRIVAVVGVAHVRAVGFWRHRLRDGRLRHRISDGSRRLIPVCP